MHGDSGRLAHSEHVWYAPSTSSMVVLKPLARSPRPRDVAKGKERENEQEGVGSRWWRCGVKRHRRLAVGRELWAPCGRLDVGAASLVSPGPRGAIWRYVLCRARITVHADFVHDTGCAL